MSEQSNSEEKIETRKLSDADKARIERNRQKALMLRQTKLIAHPYAKKDSSNVAKSIIKVQGSKFIDSGGGFLIEQTINDEENSELKDVVIPEDREPISLPVTYKECLECNEKFNDSFLLNNFDYSVCDGCRDNEDKHSLITKSEAKSDYLLKDCDLDMREPILKFITKKNPHNTYWGDMKLYLNLQIEERAMEVWGSEEALLNEHEIRDKKKEENKVKKYNKQLKALRMNVRSSIYDKTTKKHIHNFGPDSYNDSEDTYSHKCIICDYEETFEKM